LISRVEEAAGEGWLGEVLERLPAFFAEVEESDADLARFEGWAAKIEARDYFLAPIGDEVRAELERARVIMKMFEAPALAAETTVPGAGTGQAVARLRAIERPIEEPIEGRRHRR
jgi:hypothetical protein